MHVIIILDMLYLHSAKYERLTLLNVCQYTSAY